MACTEPFALAATTTLRSTLNFTAAQRPYVDAWYLAERSSGSETIEQFLIRKSVTIALNTRAQALVEACALEQEAARETSRTAQEAYRQTTRAGRNAAAGTVLP